MRFKKVLCPVDFSESSREALQVAAELARDSGAPLVLLHVWQPPMWTTDYGIQLLNDAQLEAREVEEKQLVAWRDDARRAGAGEVATRLIRGVPWDEIVGFASSDRDIDLIVMGTHGRTGLRRAVIGSVAERVVRHAPCSVMVVGSRGEAQAS